MVLVVGVPETTTTARTVACDEAGTFAGAGGTLPSGVASSGIGCSSPVAGGIETKGARSGGRRFILEGNDGEVRRKN